MYKLIPSGCVDRYAILGTHCVSICRSRTEYVCRRDWTVSHTLHHTHTIHEVQTNKT